VIETFVYAFVALTVIFDPPGTAAIFIGITPHDTRAERREQAIRATWVSFFVLAFFGIAGEWLLRVMGIGVGAFQVAGGILLFLLAADMVMQRDSGFRQTEKERAEAERTPDDISVFPLAIPLLAGPGAMTTIVLLRGRAGDDAGNLVALALALAAALLLVLAALLAAERLTKALGQLGNAVLSRVLGVVLAALAAQIALDGVRAALG
jgi:multiple antibiotic resistance protein